MGNLEMRSFADGDEEAIYDLHIKGLQQSESLIIDPAAREQLDQDLRNIRAMYLDNRGEFLVVIHEGKIIGMGGLKKVDEDTAEIKRVRVALEFQGRKIGSMILDRLLERAKKLGYKKLILNTAPKQIKAQKLYESRNFKEYKRGVIFGQEAIYYERNL